MCIKLCSEVIYQVSWNLLDKILNEMPLFLTLSHTISYTLTSSMLLNVCEFGCLCLKYVCENVLGENDYGDEQTRCA